MSIIDTLVYDRTVADVKRWKYLQAKNFSDMTAEEKTEWNAGLKGAYNVSDLNRVGAAVSYLAGRLTGCGYAVTVTDKRDWAMGDEPTAAQLGAYLSDVAAIRGALTVAQATPPAPPDMLGLTWQEANDIEQILLNVDKLLTNMAAAWFYSGEIYAGEV